MYTLEKNNSSPLCILCMLMPQITPLLTLVFVHKWHEESTPKLVVLLEESISLVCKCEEQNIVFGSYQGKWSLSTWHTGKLLRHELVQLACIFILLQGGHPLSNFFWNETCCNNHVCLVSQRDIGLLQWDRDSCVSKHGDCWPNNKVHSKNKVYCHNDEVTTSHCQPRPSVHAYVVLKWQRDPTCWLSSSTLQMVQHPKIWGSPSWE